MPVPSSVRLIHGDCLEVMPTLANSGVAMCFADLPYGVTRHAYDIKVNFERFWTAVSAVNLTILTGTQLFLAEAIFTNRRNFRYDLIWQKSRPGGFLNANKMPLRAHEQLSVFYRKAPPYNPQYTDAGKPSNRQSKKRTDALSVVGNSYGTHRGVAQQRNSNLRYPISVLSFDNVNTAGIRHPAQKPVALLEWLIKTYTNEGDTVLDPCMGSGTTGAACVKTGRHFIGIEKDATYFAVAKQRIEAEQRAMEAKSAH